MSRISAEHAASGARPCETLCDHPAIHVAHVANIADVFGTLATVMRSRWAFCERPAIALCMLHGFRDRAACRKCCAIASNTSCMPCDCLRRCQVYLQSGIEQRLGRISTSCGPTSSIPDTIVAWLSYDALLSGPPLSFAGRFAKLMHYDGCMPGYIYICVYMWIHYMMFMGVTIHHFCVFLESSCGSA